MKVRLKIWFGEGYKNIFAGGGVWSLIGEVEIFQKRGAWQERGEEKNRGGCELKRNYGPFSIDPNFNYSLITPYYVTLITSLITFVVNKVFLSIQVYTKTGLYKNLFENFQCS